MIDYESFEISIADKLYEELLTKSVRVDVELNQVITDLLWKAIVHDLEERMYDPSKDVLYEQGDSKQGNADREFGRRPIAGTGRSDPSRESFVSYDRELEGQEFRGERGED
jgi:hypothetical protein